MLIRRDKDKNRTKDPAAEKVRTEAALSDDELSVVAGGTGVPTGDFWSADGISTFDSCSHGGSHEWETSPGGNFKYCKKCHSELFY